MDDVKELKLQIEVEKKRLSGMTGYHARKEVKNRIKALKKELQECYLTIREKSQLKLF